MKKAFLLMFGLVVALMTSANNASQMKQTGLKPLHPTHDLTDATTFRQSLLETTSTFSFQSSIPKGWTSEPKPKSFETSGLSRGAQYTADATITSPNATDVTEVKILCSSNIAGKNTIQVTVGGTQLGETVTLSKQNDVELTFSGTSCSGDLVIAITRQDKSVYIKQVTVTGTLDITPEKDTLQLDPAWQYDEPTVFAPTQEIGSSTTYAFVDQNVRIYCTAGARYAEYIGCNAGASITFTATKAFKGIKINGYVKKGFTATASAGTLTYEDATEEDITADPVLLLKDINDTTVTINCVKQLRCYSISFYFEANPKDSIGGLSGDTVKMDMLDGIEIDYYPSYSEVGAFNYSFLLYTNDSTADYYPMMQFDIYTTDEKSYAGNYSTIIGNMGTYNYYIKSDESYSELQNVTLSIVDNGSGNYIVSGVADDGKKTYTFDVTATADYFNAEYPYEPETPSTISLGQVNGEEDNQYLSEYGEIDINVDMGDEYLTLAYLAPSSASYQQIPDGTYPIETCEYDEEGYIIEQDYGYFAAGEWYSTFSMPYNSYYATEEAYWYLKGGEAVIATDSQGRVLTLNATTYYGSTITATIQLSESTAVENTTADKAVNVEKRLQNGHIVIIRGEQIYSIIGNAL